jgi:cobaltochelatase CobN
MKVPLEVNTSRKTLGQVLVCLGCCCGRTDKGHPAVPVDWLKEQWRKHQLPKKIHLSISGCLGPCDASNVVLLLVGGEQIWLGGIKDHSCYELLVEWAAGCAASQQLLPLPLALEPYRLQRFLSIEEISKSQVA